jgi:ribosomal protein L37AE/L43A
MEYPELEKWPFLKELAGTIPGKDEPRLSCPNCPRGPAILRPKWKYIKDKIGMVLVCDDCETPLEIKRWLHGDEIHPQEGWVFDCKNCGHKWAGLLYVDQVPAGAEVSIAYKCPECGESGYLYIKGPYMAKYYG